MRIVRAADYRRMPWKNGGGVTTEIAVFPQGAGLDDFEWRISMAMVAGDGPFSLFAHVDRTLAVLEGDGILLEFEGQPGVTLTRASEPFAFPADKRTSARLIAGPIVDLNVMTRRGRFGHCVERLAPSAQVALDREASLTIVFCANGSANLSSAGERAVLGRRDVAIVDARCEIENREAAELYVISLENPASNPFR